MAGFKTNLLLEPVHQRKWRIRPPFCYETNISPLTRKPHVSSYIYKVEAKEGDTTDLTSVPRIAWPLLPPNHPDYAFAAVVHDLCYQKAIFSKAWADAVFLEALGVLGCPKWKKWLLFATVKIFGKGSY